MSGRGGNATIGREEYCFDDALRDERAAEGDGAGKSSGAAGLSGVTDGLHRTRKLEAIAEAADVVRLEPGLMRPLVEARGFDRGIAAESAPAEPLESPEAGVVATPGAPMANAIVGCFADLKRRADGEECRGGVESGSETRMATDMATSSADRQIDMPADMVGAITVAIGQLKSHADFRPTVSGQSAFDARHPGFCLGADMLAGVADTASRAPVEHDVLGGLALASPQASPSGASGSDGGSDVMPGLLDGSSKDAVFGGMPLSVESAFDHVVQGHVGGASANAEPNVSASADARVAQSRLGGDERITVQVSRGMMRELECRLNSAALGQLNVNLRLSDGVLDVSVSVSARDALSVLEQQRLAMLDELRKSGVEMAAVAVSHADLAAPREQGHSLAGAGDDKRREGEARDDGASEASSGEIDHGGVESSMATRALRRGGIFF